MSPFLMVGANRSEYRCRWASLWQLCTCQLQLHTLHISPSVPGATTSWFTINPTLPSLSPSWNYPMTSATFGLDSEWHRSCPMAVLNLPAGKEPGTLDAGMPCPTVLPHPKCQHGNRKTLGGAFVKARVLPSAPLGHCKRNRMHFPKPFFGATQPLYGRRRPFLFPCLRLKNATPSYFWPSCFTLWWAPAIGCVNVYTFQWSPLTIQLKM